MVQTTRPIGSGLEVMRPYRGCSPPLGPSKLGDSLGIDPASASFSSPEKVVPQPGHVYLLEQKAFRHWVLFQFELDPEDT
jgi:hypothetical protein